MRNRGAPGLIAAERGSRWHGRATVNSRMKLRRFTKRLRYRCGRCFARLNHPNPTLRGGLSMETRLPAASSPDYDAAECSASPWRRGFQPRHPQTITRRNAQPLPWRRGFQPRHPQTTTRRNARPLHGDAASSRVTSKEMRHLLESPDRSTTSLTRHILPDSETPNSESNHIAVVGIYRGQSPPIHRASPPSSPPPRQADGLTAPMPSRQRPCT